MDLERLLRLGLPLIPVGSNKKPLLPWRNGPRDYVHEPPTRTEILEWSRTLMPAGWAVLGGGPGALVVLDIEGPGWRDTGSQGRGIHQIVTSFPRSCQRPTPGGGVHVILRIADGEVPPAAGGKLVLARGQNRQEPATLLAELRTEGQYAVILGAGRGNLPDDFTPCDVTQEELQIVLGQFRALSDDSPAAAGAPIRPPEPRHPPRPLRQRRPTPLREGRQNGWWIDELAVVSPCRVMRDQADTISKELAQDRLTGAILGPIMQLVRLAHEGHQGLPVVLAALQAEFLERVDLRGDRRGGRLAALEQWDRSVHGAQQEVGTPGWIRQTHHNVCRDWLEDLVRRHRQAEPPYTSATRAKASDAQVLEYLAHRAALGRRGVSRQSQRQIAEDVQLTLPTVNASLARLERQGWIHRERGVGYRIHEIELRLPKAIVETTEQPSGEGLAVVSTMRSAVHPIFSSRGLGLSPLVVYSLLPEYRRPAGCGLLVRVPPGAGGADFRRPPSARPLPPPPSGPGRTVSDLMQLTHRNRSTVKRQLAKLEAYGLVFSDGSRRWWRFRAHPDGVAVRNGITDPTQERKELHDRQRRVWYGAQVVAGRFVRQSIDGADVYAHRDSGDVAWIDQAPPPGASAPQRRRYAKPEVVPRRR